MYTCLISFPCIMCVLSWASMDGASDGCCSFSSSPSISPSNMIIWFLIVFGNVGSRMNRICGWSLTKRRWMMMVTYIFIIYGLFIILFILLFDHQLLVLAALLLLSPPHVIQSQPAHAETKQPTACSIHGMIHLLMIPRFPWRWV